MRKVLLMIVVVGLLVMTDCASKNDRKSANETEKLLL